MRPLIARFPLASYITVAFAAWALAFVVIGPPRLQPGGAL